jgi:hypothetical protein
MGIPGVELRPRQGLVGLSPVIVPRHPLVPPEVQVTPFRVVSAGPPDGFTEAASNVSLSLLFSGARFAVVGFCAIAAAPNATAPMARLVCGALSAGSCGKIRSGLNGISEWPMTAKKGSVAGWPLDVIDHQDFRGPPTRFQLQSQCFA